MVHPFSASATPDGPAKPPTVKVSGRAGILSAVPVMLGFHPVDSVVMLCLTGPMRVGPVVRVDVPATGEQVGRVAAALADIAQRHAERVVLVIYTDAPIDTADLVWHVAYARPVVDVITVGNTPQPMHAELAAASAVHGRGVLPDRHAVARSVEHDPRVTAPGELLAEFGDVHSRDALLARLLPDPDAVATLVTVAQGTPDTDHRVPNLCAALAVLAYRHGNGTLARVAIERSRRVEPGHPLTDLVDQIITTGMPPAQMDTLAA